MSAIYENIALAAHKAKKKCGKVENITKRVFSIAEKVVNTVLVACVFAFYFAAWAAEMLLISTFRFIQKAREAAKELEEKSQASAQETTPATSVDGEAAKA